MCAPLNGPIFINGFFGDAVFRTAQDISTISRRLAAGLEVEEEVCEDGSQHSFVMSTIRLGDKGFEVKLKTKIYEDEAPNLFLIYAYTPAGPPLQPYDVILGSDFLQDMGVIIDCGAGKISSRLFGNVWSGSGNFKFQLKNFQNTNYQQDIDGRVILLFDMDCFEVQVHEQPHQRGKPRVVVNSSDRILAVSYEAKKLGINRGTTPYLRQAMAIYPRLIAIYVPTRPQRSNEGPPRPDTSIAREATARIVSAIQSSMPEGSVFQFSSGDEFYLDITRYVSQQQNERALIPQMDSLWPNTLLYNDKVVGQPTPEYIRPRLATLGRKPVHSLLENQELRLIYGSNVASKIVAEIWRKTNYQSSVGIGSKKLISKIASGMHKPGSITVLAPSGLMKFSSFIKIEDIPGLGGKSGIEVKNRFGVTTMADLQDIRYEQLQKILGEKKALHALNSAYGVDDESVEPTDWFKSSGTTRQLYGNNYTLEEIKNILKDQVDETLDKLKFERRQNNRIPKKIKMSLNISQGENLHSTVDLVKGQPLPNRDDLFRRFCMDCNLQLTRWNPNSEANNVKIVAQF